MRLIHLLATAVTLLFAGPALANSGFVACHSYSNNPGSAEPVAFHNVVAGAEADVPALSSAYLGWLKSAPVAQAALGKGRHDPRLARLQVACTYHPTRDAALAAVTTASAQWKGRGYTNISTAWVPAAPAG